MICKLTWIVSFFLVACINQAIAAVGSTGLRALVLYDPVYDDLADLDSVTPQVKNLLSTLEEEYGYDVVATSYDEEGFSLYIAGEPRFNHLVLLPSSKKAIGAKAGLTQHDLMKFVNEEGNVLIVGSPDGSLPEGQRVFLNELGIYPSPKNYRLIDNFNNVNGKVKLTDENLDSNSVISSLNLNYNGSVAIIDNNELLFPLVRSPKTGYASSGKEKANQDNTWAFGEQGFLAVALQSLNNARVSWVGSTDLLVDDLIQWTFQEKGVLKLQFVEHIKADEPELPDREMYRIKDQVIYTIGISEYKNKKWIPFEQNDVQVSFKMLDPYQRLNMKSLGPASSLENSDVKDTQVYSVNFTIPDHHGMFTFELDYKRHGLSYLVDKRVVAVRHLANDEYKRSWDITNSWLYMASASLVTLSWLVFVVLYIFMRKVDVTKKNI